MATTEWVRRYRTKYFLQLWQKSVDSGGFLWYSNSCLSRRYGGVAQLARARGSYPRCHRFKSSRRYHRGREETLSRIPTGFSFLRPVGQEVKTRPFHGCNMGSIPVRVTKSALRSGAPIQYGGLAQLVRAPASHAGGHWFESSSLHHEKTTQ